MAIQLDKLGRALNEDSYDFLLREYPQVLAAIEEEVRKGNSPEVIGDFVMTQIGPDRMAFVRRCVSAAKHLEQVK